jgi:pyruvate ferredoxin oxidoreductase alpha subunit
VQEVVDLVLLAYRLAEDRRVRLPAIVNLDGFLLSFTREPVVLPEAEAAARFVGPFDPGPLGFRASRPISQAVAVLGSVPYSYFRYELHRAAEGALGVWDELCAAFETAFGRRYDALELYRAEDAEVVFFLIGSLSTQAKDAVDRLREAGVRAGLVRPRLFRPWPAAALRRALAGARAVAVLDQDLSMGLGGVLHAELAAALHGAATAPLLVSFVGGLGGRDVGADELCAMAEEARGAAERGSAPPPRLLFTEPELRELRKLQGIALSERQELSADAPGARAARPGAREGEGGA